MSEDKPKVKPTKYLGLEAVKYCLNCGKSAIMQQPQETATNWLICGACGVKFRVELP